MKIRLYQVGFLPIYLPFYVSFAKAVSRLRKLYGNVIEVECHVNESDEKNLKEACKNHMEDTGSVDLVLTALYNVQQLFGDRSLCNGCEKSCKSPTVRWEYPWIFIIKFPVWGFKRGGNASELSWENLKSDLKRLGPAKVYAYPEGSTIHNVLKKVGAEVTDEINFEGEKDEVKNITENSVVFTLAPYIYSELRDFCLVLKPSNHFFPFTGLAFPKKESEQITSFEVTLLNFLEEEYLRFMFAVQKARSPFAALSGSNEPAEGEVEKHVNESVEIWEKLRNSCRIPNLKDFLKPFFAFFSAGCYRERPADFLKDSFLGSGWRQYDLEFFEERTKDVVHAVISRNFSHHIGSNVIPRVLQTSNQNCDDFKRLLEVIQKKTDYIAWLIGSGSLEPTAFRSMKLIDLVRPASNYLRKTYLKHLYSSVYRNFRFEFQCDKDIRVGVPPFLGEQAFLSIMENIVRNSVKHMDKPANSNTLEYTIKAGRENGYVKLTILDHCEPRGSISDVVREITEKLNTASLDFSGNKIPYYWGLKELKVGAAVLRGNPLETIDLVVNPPLVEVKNEDGKLAYVFRLLPYNNFLDPEKGTNIPAEFLIVSVSQESYFKNIRNVAKAANLQEARREWLSRLSGEKGFTLKVKTEKSECYRFGSGNLLLLYEHHGSGCENCHFYRAFSGAESVIVSFIREATKNLDPLNNYYAFKLAESALVGVGIVDERIQSKFGKLRQTYESMRIYFPEEDLTELLQKPRMDELKSILGNLAENKNLHFIVLHLSIIEAVSNGKSVLESLRDVRNYLKEISPDTDLLLTTGRGRSEIASEVIIPVSSLMEALELKDKIALTELLISFSRENYFKGR